MIGTMTDEGCLGIFILFFVVIVVIAALFSREKKGGKLPPQDLDKLLENVTNQMRHYETSTDYKKKKITVTKDSFTATNIFFKRLRTEEIEIRHGMNLGLIGWVLLLILTFITIIGGVVFAIILFYHSNKFAKDDVIPMIIERTESERLSDLHSRYFKIYKPTK